MTIHSSQAAQIFDNNPIQVITLNHNEACINVPVKYLDFLDVFSKKKALVLPERTDLNKHVIDLEGDKS